MMKHVYIVGDKGNMALRYKTILRYFGVSFSGHDKLEQIEDVERADGILICTPTDNHIDDITTFLHYRKPILCEKPLSKDSKKLKEAISGWGSNAELVTMVDQYHQLVNDENDGWTGYNYYKSGSDGLYWDCINIVGKAKEGIIINNQSPIWRCQINGEELSIANMDQAYVNMIHSWLRHPESNLEYALEAHEKVEQCIQSL